MTLSDTKQLADSSGRSITPRSSPSPTSRGTDHLRQRQVLRDLRVLARGADRPGPSHHQLRHTTRRSSSATCGGRSPTAASGTARSATGPRTGTSTGWTRRSCRSSTSAESPTSTSRFAPTSRRARRRKNSWRRQAALARVGQMAAVVAHEVRNPLAGIKGAIQILMSRRRPHDGELPVMRDIVGRIDALSELINDLMVFARPRAPRLAARAAGAARTRPSRWCGATRPARRWRSRWRADGVYRPATAS